MLPIRPEPLDFSIDSPTVSSWVSQTFVIRAPHDLHVKCAITEKGLKLDWLDDSFDVPPSEVFDITTRAMWREPDKPTIQWGLNNLFVADEPVFMETCAPFLEYKANAWPGTYVAGKLDIQKWTRMVQWVLEWHDMDGELHIERGDPIKYVRFHTPKMDEKFELVDIEHTRELEQAILRCAKAVPYKKNVLSLADEALKRRPARWIK